MKKMISRRNFLKVCAVAGSAVALSACGGSKKPAAPDPSNTDQTSFDIVGGQSALSPGYNDNEVLKKLADNVGIKMNYETMSDSLSEQVNIRIAGDQLPDAFMGVGFSNYDIANYGADGTFLDLTPYYQRRDHAQPDQDPGRAPNHPCRYHHERRLHLRSARCRADGHCRYR